MGKLYCYALPVNIFCIQGCVCSVQCCVQCGISCPQFWCWSVCSQGRLAYVPPFGHFGQRQWDNRQTSQIMFFERKLELQPICDPSPQPLTGAALCLVLVLVHYCRVHYAFLAAACFSRGCLRRARPSRLPAHCYCLPGIVLYCHTLVRRGSKRD